MPEAHAPDIAKVVVDALSFTWNGVPILADASPVGKSWGAVYAK